jgi:hypothetical protein
MTFLNLEQAFGLTETKLMVFDKLIDLSKKLDGKITTKQLISIRDGLIEMASEKELELLREKIYEMKQKDKLRG